MSCTVEASGPFEGCFVVRICCCYGTSFVQSAISSALHCCSRLCHLRSQHSLTLDQAISSRSLSSHSLALTTALLQPPSCPFVQSVFPQWFDHQSLHRFNSSCLPAQPGRLTDRRALIDCLFCVQASTSDQATGAVLLLIALNTFLYYTAWTLVLVSP